MGELVTTREAGAGLVVLRLDAGPGNLLSWRTVAALTAGLDTLARREDLRGVVLAGRGDVFSAGIDRADPEAPWAALEALAERIEGFDRPVIAALHGPALAEGAQLALACAGIVARPGAVLALPQVRAGEVPSARACRSLAARCPTGTALRMLCLGEGAVAEEGAEGPFLSVTADPVAEALSLLPDLPRARTHPLVIAAVRRFRRAHPGLRGAAAALAEALAAEAASPAAGARAFAALPEAVAQDPAARALRHLFLAERRAGPDLLDRGDGALGLRGAQIEAELREATHRALAALLRRGHLDAATQAALSRRLDLDRRDLPADVRMRLLGALVGAGARLLARGTARDAGEIDVIATRALRLPRHLGGPLHAAEAAGLPVLVEQMKRWTADDPVWEPSAHLLRESVSRMRWRS